MLIRTMGDAIILVHLFLWAAIAACATIFFVVELDWIRVAQCGAMTLLLGIGWAIVKAKHSG